MNPPLKKPTVSGFPTFNPIREGVVGETVGFPTFNPIREGVVGETVGFPTLTTS